MKSVRLTLTNKTNLSDGDATDLCAWFEEIIRELVALSSCPKLSLWDRDSNMEPSS